MISGVNAVNGYAGAASVKTVSNKIQASFAQALAMQKINTDTFSASGSSGLTQSQFEEMRLRFGVKNMTWKQGQSLVAELVSKGVLPSDFNDLGNAIAIMFPPEDALDKYGNRLIGNGANWAELKMDDGFENTADYAGTLKSSLEHQWQAYNSMVEKYGDIYPNEKTYLQEQEKLLGILQGMAAA